MIGLSRQEIEKKIEIGLSWAYSDPITQTDFKRVLESLVKSVAETIEENNKRIEDAINRTHKQ